MHIFERCWLSWCNIVEDEGASILVWTFPLTLIPSWNHSNLEPQVIQQVHKLLLGHASQRHSLILIWIHAQKVVIGQSPG